MGVPVTATALDAPAPMRDPRPAAAVLVVAGLVAVMVTLRRFRIAP